MKYWDEVLFPSVLTVIRGERYLAMSDQQIANELITLAKQAINTFLFPRVGLDYAYEDDVNNVAFPKRYYFVDDNVSDKEIAILIAWMNFFWCKLIVSNSDNFNNIYFDSNIKSFSPGNVLHNYRVMMENYRDEARRLESRYYRAGNTGTDPLIGGTIDDD